MPSSLHLAELTPDERFRELARLLAMGVLRLAVPIIPAETPPLLATKISSKFDTNELAESPQKSVTVHAD